MELWELRTIGFPEKMFFSPESSMLEQAGGNADMWSHMETLMGVRAGSSHQHPNFRLGF